MYDSGVQNPPKPRKNNTASSQIKKSTDAVYVPSPKCQKIHRQRAQFETMQQAPAVVVHVKRLAGQVNENGNEDDQNGKKGLHVHRVEQRAKRPDENDDDLPTRRDRFPPL